MVVQNSDGVDGIVTTTEFKSAASDGCILCQEAIGVFTPQPLVHGVSCTIDDFTPVVTLSDESIITIVGKGPDITSADGLLEIDPVIYGFSGSGNPMELPWRQFFGVAGVEATGISYDGSSPTVTVLLSGYIDACTGHPDRVMQHVEPGDVAAIGTFNDERDPRESLKDIPAFKEMGYGVTMSVWKFLMLSVDIPEDVVAKMIETLVVTTETDKYRKFCDANQLLPLTLTIEEMVERINEEATVNQKLLAD